MNNGIHTVNIDSPIGSWALSTLAPPADIADTVQSLWAVRGRADFRREAMLPSAKVELMFNLGEEFRVTDRDNGFGGERFRHAWIAGLQERPITIEPAFDPRSVEAHHVAITLTPHGARKLFGLPMSELRDRVWELEVLLGQVAGALREMLLDASGLGERFRILIDWVRASIDRRGRDADRHVRYAQGLLTRSCGQTRISTLCKEMGVSRSWLARRFNEQVGLSPKRFARLQRFIRVIDTVERAAQVSWSDVALQCGYFDQAHLIREFRDLAATTPREYLRQRAPGGGSVVIQ